MTWVSALEALEKALEALDDLVEMVALCGAGGGEEPASGAAAG